MGGVHSSSPDGDTHRASAWVVLGSSGQWSDWTQWAVAAYADEQAAKDFVGRVTAEIREVMADEPDTACGEDGEHTPEYDAWLARLNAADPSCDPYEQSHYTAVEVPFYAAIRKATGEAA